MKSLYCKVIFIPLFVMCSSLSLLAQRKQTQTPPPTSKPSVPARTVPKPAPKLAPAPTQTPAKPVEKTYYAYLLVTTDLDVKLIVNGERNFIIHAADDVVKIGLDPNDNLIRVVPLDSGSDEYTTYHKAERPGNTIFRIDLAAKRKEKEANKNELVKNEKEKRKEEITPITAEEGDEVYQSIEQEMVFVKGGSFGMGDANGQSDEKPVHSVTVSDFYLGKTEVTQSQWQALMGTNPSSFKNCDQCPVENVSWDDAQEFIKKLNAKTGKTYRLPTEAEWEYAAQGGKSQTYTYTYARRNSVDEIAWYDSNAGGNPHQVGQKKANELGLYDMSGNVYEWCQDWYDGDYYAKSPSSNPTGPDTGSFRVIRGGSWYGSPANVRVVGRNGSAPDIRGSLVGFRLARQQ